MDRLEDTICYINSLELRKNDKIRSAFDFYDFINNAFIVIDCIKTIGRIFRIDDHLIEEIENSSSVFGKRLDEKCTDAKYFEYIRSLCSVHPLCTNHQKIFLNNSKFHCCPFVTWKTSLTWINSEKDADLMAFIYPSNSKEKVKHHGLYVSQFEKYLTKWINFIPKVIEAKNNYTNARYEELRKEQVKSLSDFDNNVVYYLTYLKSEFSKRFAYGTEYIFDEYVSFFIIKLSDSRNYTALKKYQNAILYSLGFVRNELQNMSLEGFENNGIQHPEPSLETTLFSSLYEISAFEGAFSKYSYNLEKVYYLGQDYDYSFFDKEYARRLLEEPKELINKYVFFTNSEPDEEAKVLVKLALYLESLTRKSLLNKNIPNTLQYRMQVLSDQQYNDLFLEEENDDEESCITQNLLEFLKEYGG